MTTKDMRPYLHMARENGVWIGTIEQVMALEKLTTYPQAIVVAAVTAIVNQFDAPTPKVVLDQISGIRRNTPEPVIHPFIAITTKCSKRRRSTKPSGSKTGRTTSRRKTYRKSSRYARRSA